jgi:hypothetical protein
MAKKPEPKKREKTKSVRPLDHSRVEIRVADKLLTALQREMGELAPHSIDTVAGFPNDVIMNFYFTEETYDKGVPLLEQKWRNFALTLRNRECSFFGQEKLRTPHAQGEMRGVTYERLESMLDRYLAWSEREP